MTEPLPDTWHSRDLPVLRAIVRLCDPPPHWTVPPRIAQLLPDLSDDDVDRAIAALSGNGYFSTHWRADGRAHMINEVTGLARRLSGAWPSADSVADRLLAELRDLAEYGPDEATKTKARKALDALGGFSRDVLVGVISSAAGVAMQG